MRQITKKDLARMKKRGGVKIKRRRSEKLESDAEGSSVLSGIAEAKAPAPASEPLTPILEKMTDVLVRLEERELPKEAEKLSSMLADAKEKTDEQEEQERLIMTVVSKVVDATIKAKEKTLPKIDPVQIVKKTPWTHAFRRSNTGHVEQVVSSDESGNTWTHDILREDELIKEVVSTRT